MRAKKTGHTKTATPSPKKKRTRFPRIAAARPGEPLIEAATKPTAEAAAREDAAEITAPEPGPAGPTPEAMGVQGPAGDAATTGEATAGDALPSPANPPESLTDDRVAGGEARTTASRPEVSGPSPTPQATTELPAAETTATEAMTDGMAPEAALAESAGTASEAPEMEKKQRETRATTTKSTTADGPTKKLSALDAAAQVLAEVGQAMGCKEMIAAMAAKGYWTSPGGQTPEATLYSAMAREITTKGTQARFVKAGRGKFALRPQA